MNLYHAPDSELATAATSLPKHEVLGKVLSWVSVLMLFSALGLIATTLEIISLYQSITLYGKGDPKIMSSSISTALVPMVMALILALPGYIAALVAIYVTDYRSKGVFRFWVFSSVVLLISVPVGVLFGALLAVVLFIKRHEFRK
ncbi:MotA/TolQ/ExbB proton channel family protein [Thalassotalea sp. PS06]|uniref:MotA/TolQ/ExbB proton channel family protein n=1 Tax=Thalassotalea sp. PS06 TaxID=2594005 RepID=UPI001164B666|nr:MotA/TolQ/ExbB proton channel family protein [Thalassotalea sp. PS06]QDP01499.1 MotA/TolQ/ExbB proton channel family protein [Thalassotalea sp. PS06]